MPIHVLTHKGPIGSFQPQIIDEAMGVLGGKLQVTNLYIHTYQDLFRGHIHKPNWPQIKQVGLKAVTEAGYALRPQGGICITDLEEFPDEIGVEVCGLSPEEIALLMAS